MTPLILAAGHTAGPLLATGPTVAAGPAGPVLAASPAGLVLAAGPAGLPDLQLLFFAAGLLVLAGLIAMTEAALAAISPARAAELARDGARGARTLQLVAGDVVRHLNLLLLLRLLTELTATTLVALVAVDTFGAGWRAALITAGAMTVVSFVAVGVAPRTLGRQHAYSVGRAVAPLVRWLGRALNPLASLLILIGNAVTPGRGFREGPFATQVELRELVDLAEQRGVVEHGERQMIEKVFALGGTIAREVMVPRTEMVWIERGKTLSQALALFLRSGFSRIPVIGESVDDVLGVLYLKDLIRRTQGGAAEDARCDVAELMRPATFVPESKPVDDLLSEMQAARRHLVIVVDEYGGTGGLVTIEDILEEIVGEITDEYDVERPPVEHLDDGAVRVTARLPVEDLGELFDTELPTDEVETVGGLLAQALGRVPIPGAQAEVAGLSLVAEGTTGRRNRIDTLLVSRAEPRHEAGQGEQSEPRDNDNRSEERQPADA
ncbi:hemolysin family protein [Micromonospora yangpuensis]|uniref:Hemolysin, contains CBS domains n=1 Tax=Micromonospora yangpuensis TaxID=683228 RepID=A0A1C6V5C6_9ACTN|nr:hemolysin family protein [Micromonospora yangpuensis]GGM15956.1 membrane protein [Micromonospora yangpuensis]SCL61254.1 Hemolysin, contains CBS domains [Micromonospora yangpuensis]